jgi:hypothetical protein
MAGFNTRNEVTQTALQNSFVTEQDVLLPWQTVHACFALRRMWQVHYARHLLVRNAS